MIWIGGAVCEVLPFYSTVNSITCITPPAPTRGNSVQPIKMMINHEMQAICNAQGGCVFSYTVADTPVLKGLTPTAALSDQVISFQGRLIEDDPLQFDGLSVGEIRCSTILGEDQESSVSMNWRLDNYFGYTDKWGGVSCKLGDMEPGYYNASMNINGRGKADISQSDWLLSPDNTPYHFAAVPVIRRLSENSGSLHGGSLLVIDGSGFSSKRENNSVLVDGNACTVISSSSSQITCKTTPMNASYAGYHSSGGRGIIREIWRDVTGWGVSTLRALSSFPDSPDETQLIVGSFEVPLSSSNTEYGDRMYSLFAPRSSGSHTFYLSCSSHAELWLSASEDAQGATKIVETNWSPYRIFQSPSFTAKSATIQLQRGKLYYIELVQKHQQGNDYASIGVRYSSDQRTVNSIRAVQEIRTQSSVQREVQSVRLVNVQEGSFRLAWKSSATVYMNVSSPASTVSTLVSQIANIGSVSVSKFEDSNSIMFNITFNSPSLEDRPLFLVDESMLTEKSGLSILTSVSRVQQASIPIQGSFDVMFGESSIVIPYNADSTKMKLLLQNLPGIGVITVYQSGNGLDNNIWTVIFDTYDGTPPLLITRSNLTGSDASVSVREVRPASNDILLGPIPGDMFVVPKNTPQVQVISNGIQSACMLSSDCSFNYSVSLTPSILNIDPVGGNDVSVMTINGQNFALDSSDNSVSVGGFDCPIIISSETEIVCQLTHFHGGSNDVIVTVSGKGDSNVVFFSADYEVYGLSPEQGNFAGGTVITITGYGFYHRTHITLGGRDCEVISYELEEIQCLAPAVEAIENTLNVTLDIDGTPTSFWFNYSLNASPVIYSVSPQIISLFSVGQELVIYGDQFSDELSGNSIKLGNDQCKVVFASENEVRCTITASSSGILPLQFTVKEIGRAMRAPEVEVACIIDSIQPNSGSIAGGTLITVRGRGLKFKESISVFVGDLVCEIQEDSEDDAIKCITAYVGYSQIYDLVIVDSQGDQLIKASCAGNCTFEYSSEKTPIVHFVNRANGQVGDKLIIGGEGFGKNPNVSIGKEPSHIDSHNSSHIECIIPEHEASTNNEIDIRFEELGSAMFIRSSLQLLDFDLSLDSVSQSVGSVAGFIATFFGSGFSVHAARNKVKIGMHDCVVRSSTYSELTCIVGQRTDDILHPISISVNDVYAECSNCNMSYSWELTPRISTWGPTSGRSGSILTIEGDGFTNDTQVLIGSYICEILEETKTLVTCAIPEIPFGQYSLSLFVAEKGYSLGSVNMTYTSILDAGTVSSNEPISFAGGETVRIVNAIGLSQDTSITICGFDCNVQSFTYSSIDCLAPRLLNHNSSIAFNWKNEKVLRGEVFGMGTPESSMVKYSNVFDGDEKSFFTSNYSSRSSCSIGVDIGSRFVANPSRVKFLPRNDIANGRQRVNGRFEASMSSIGPWTVIKNIDSLVDSGWNTFEIVNDDAFRYFRYVGGPDSYCSLAEVEFYGFEIANNYDGVCEVHISMNGTKRQSSGNITYSMERTAVIASVYPTNGTAAGGTLVSLSGFGFGTEVTRVTINTVECSVESVTDTLITCITGKRENVNEDSSIVIDVPNKGKAAQIENVRFTYFDKWSANTTWGNTHPPVEGESVVIPPGQTILLDISPPKLKLLIIQGTLIFEDEQDLEVKADYIFIEGGKLQIGTEDSPFQHKATITLFGDRENSKEIPMYGAKCMALRTGVVDMHGAPKVSWVKLNETVAPGTNIVQLSQETDWGVGDSLVVAPTDLNWLEAEEIMIVEVINAHTFKISPSFKFSHSGSIQQLEGILLDTRAEVGLLTRNVKFQGDEDSTEQEYGAHFMIHSRGEDSSIARISNCEFTRVGQAHGLGRYPIHFHMLGNVKKSYVKNNSIHHTWNRAVALHGVHYLRVYNNVAYHCKGHTYFIEDGIETNNELINNLGVMTLPSFSLLNSDVAPAVFWVTNPNNILKHNVAAGSGHYGFWFDLFEHPTGASAGNDHICPKNTPLGTFNDNTAHSVGRYGLRVFESFSPRVSPCQDVSTSNPTVPAVFTKFTAYKNGRCGMIATLVGDVTFKNFIVSDNSRAGLEVSWILPEAPVNSASIQDSVIIAISNLPNPSEGLEAGGLVTPRTENFFVRNVTFINFISPRLPALSSCSKCGVSPVLNQGGYTTKFAGLKFLNSPFKVRWGFPRKEIYYDEDGSLTGFVHGWTIPAHSHNNHTACSYNDHFDGFTCDSSIAIRRMAVYNYLPTNTLRQKDIIITSRYGQSNIAWMDKSNPTPGWVAPIIMDEMFEVYFDTYVDWEKVSFMVNRIQPNDTFYLRLNHTDFRDHFEVETKSSTILSGNSSLCPTAPHGSSFYNDTEKTVDVVFRGTPINYELSSNWLTIYGRRCPVTGCPQNPRPGYEYRKGFWSDPLFWRGEIPTLNSDVLIKPGWIVIMDISPPKLRNLEIQGTLIFDDKDLTLDADTIYLRNGTLQIGDEHQPFTYRATITLHGTSKSFPLLIAEEFDLGPKVLANFGALKLFGPSRSIFSRLASTSNAGALRIIVEGKVDWKVGETIVIGTSSSNLVHSEKRVITSISSQNGNTILGLNSALQYRHHGALFNMGSRTLDNRAIVALLSRNIVIQGSNTSEQFGAHIFVGQYDIDRGTTSLNGVEIRNTGQFDNHRASIVFKGLFDASDQLISNCSIHDGFNNAILIQSTNLVQIDRNVVFKTITSAFVCSFDTESNTLTNNIAIWAEHLPYADKELRPFASFDMRGRNNIAKNNIAVGSEYFGFLVEADSCNTDDRNLRFLNNEVHGAWIGVYMTNTTQKCHKISQWLVSKTSHIAFLHFTHASVEASNLVSLDTGIGSSLNVAWYGDQNQYTLVEDSVFVGESNNYDPSTNVDCYSRVGAYTAIHDENGKIIPPTKSMLPWEKPVHDPSLFGKDGWNRITFANFFTKPKRNCNNIVDQAFKANPKGPDVVRIQSFRETTWINVDQNARFYIDNPNPAWRNEDDCGTMDCEGLKQVAFKDIDGTLTGTGAQSSVVSYNPNIVDPSRCSLIPSWNAYQCKNLEWLQLLLYSLDPDALTRRVAPLKVVNTNTGLTDFLNNPQDHRWQLDYTSHLRLTAFWPLVENGVRYELSFTGTNPTNMMFHLPGALPSTSVVCSLKYTNPSKVRVYDSNGRLIAAKPLSSPVASDVNGANYFDYKKRILIFVVRGGDYVELLQVPIIQVSIRMDVDLDNFFENNFVENMAAVLGIEKSSIRIVDIRRGSTIVDFEIEPPILSNNKTNSTSLQAETETLHGVLSLLSAKASNGDLARHLGYPILNIAFVVVNNTDNSTRLFQDPGEIYPTQSKNYAGLYVLYALVAVCIVLLLFILVGIALIFLYVRRSQKKMRSHPEVEMKEAYDFNITYVSDNSGFLDDPPTFNENAVPQYAQQDSL